MRGAVGIAAWARIPAALIGATIAAFATSSPEVSVAVNASLDGFPEIAFGNALGANLLNIGLVLGIALLLGTIGTTRDTVRRDLPAAILAPVAIAALALDGVLSTFDALLLIGIFGIWLAFSVRDAWRGRKENDSPPPTGRPAFFLLAVAAGLGLLVLAGELIVVGAEYIGELLGWSPFVVGATLVSIGTTSPELATALISRVRGHDEIGLGTLFGSCIFNALFITGLAGLITPISVRGNDVWIGLFMGLLALVAVIPDRELRLARWRSPIVLGIYFAYVFLLIRLAPSGT